MENVLQAYQISLDREELPKYKLASVWTRSADEQIITRKELKKVVGATGRGVNRFQLLCAGMVFGYLGLFEIEALCSFPLNRSAASRVRLI
jgi:hypothetical protein